MKPNERSLDFGIAGTRLERRTRLFVAAGILVAGVLGGLLIAAQFVEIIPGFSTGELHRSIDAAGPWGPALFLGLLAGSVVLAPIPNTPFFIAAGLVWGPWVGSLLSLAGMAIGSMVAFLLAQYLTRSTLRRLVGAKTWDRIEPWSRGLGTWAVFWARLLPVTNFDWINYLAGLTPMRLVSFTTATMLGILPATVATVVAGAAIEDHPLVTLGITAAWVIAFALSCVYIRRNPAGEA